jgi:hypothetical protein
MNQHEEFQKLEFNPFVLKKNERMVSKYPMLEQIKGFVEAEDSLIRYICVLYDPDSAVRDIKDLNERKKEAASLVKLIGDKESIYLIEDEDVLELITNFLIYKGNMEWHLLCSAEHAFHQYNRLIMSPESKNKLKLLNESSELKDKIKDYYNNLFGEEKKVVKKAKLGIASNV